MDKENKELKDRIKLLELKMSPDDKNFMKKIISLEKNLEQVNLMYHQVVTQKSVLKIENQVNNIYNIFKGIGEKDKKK